jgi:hypothetical protein
MRWSIQKQKQGFIISHEMKDGRIVRTYPQILKRRYKVLWPYALVMSVRAILECERVHATIR